MVALKAALEQGPQAVWMLAGMATPISCFAVSSMIAFAAVAWRAATNTASWIGKADDTFLEQRQRGGNDQVRFAAHQVELTSSLNASRMDGGTGLPAS